MPPSPVPIPSSPAQQPRYNRLVTYYKKWDHKRTVEPWSGDQIETNYHDVPMSLVQ